MMAQESRMHTGRKIAHPNNLAGKQELLGKAVLTLNIPNTYSE